MGVKEDRISMNTSNIFNCLAGDRHANALLEGVFPRDEFIKKLENGRGYGLYVFNTHDSSKSGEHWVAARYTRDTIDLFDSFGRNPRHFLNDVWEKAVKLVKEKNVNWNDRQVQGITSSTCGDYCVLFGLLLARGWEMKEIVDKILNIKDTELRDHAIRRFIINRYGEGAVGELSPRLSDVTGLDGVHVQAAIPFILSFPMLLQ